MLDTFSKNLLKPLLNMGIIFGSADEIVLLIRRSLVRAQVEEPLHNPLLHERIRGFSFG